MSYIIQTKNIERSFNVAGKDVPILKDISIDIAKGEFVSIMGPSGCGKSTLLYLLGGIDQPSSGTVLLNGTDIHTLKDKEKSRLRRQSIGFVFQFYNLVQNLTVEENIMLPVTMDGKKARDYRERLNELLQLVGLTERKQYTPRELSGGQQQRVAIARALMLRPSLILADEPIGNLDSEAGENVMRLFQNINNDLGVTIVQVTHSEQAAHVGKRILQMKDGVIRADEVVG